jgi:hypothetical protein
MTINRLKKRYYGLSFFISILIATSIIFADHVFSVFVKVPIKYNQELNLQKNAKESEKLTYIKNINKLQERNNIYLSYNIDYKKLELELNSTFQLFNSKIKIFEIRLNKIDKDDTYFNIVHVYVTAHSANEYITTKFAQEGTLRLIKENFGDSAEDIKIKDDGTIYFKYIKLNKNEILKK